jgi:amidase
VPELEEKNVSQLQADMATGALTARAIVEWHLERIERIDPMLRSVLEVNPDALEIADALDRERAERGPRGPLHGIPVLLKDNVETADHTQTTAGSLALVDAPVERDATVAARLRATGAVLLGKTNMSEWANWRSTRPCSGWSGRGRQTRNPFVTDRSPCGSSSGSAVAVSANLAVVALGTETDGSIVCPSAANGVVGIKPTVGLTSRAGVIPISHTQDTVGPHGRSVADAAAVLGALVGSDERDPATLASEGHFERDYTRYLLADGLRGAHVGLARKYHTGFSEHADAVFEQAVEALRRAGAEVTDDVELPGEAELRAPLDDTDLPAERIIMEYEFKADLNSYLAARRGARIRSLAELIQFNLDHAEQEMPYFGQERFLACEARGPLSDDLYRRALEHTRTFAEGFAAMMAERGFDALVAPTTGQAWVIDQIAGDRGLGSSSQPAAVAGFPLVSVPAGFAFGHLPIGMTFMGPAWSEPTLIRLAYAFEQAHPVRRRPAFVPTLELP